MPDDAMDREQWVRVKEIVAGALAMPEAGRLSYIAAQCGVDDELRAEIESLVAAAADAATLYESLALTIDGHSVAHETLDDLLRDMPSDRADPAMDVEAAAGRRIGRYRVERHLGRGGMGTVFLAERDDDVYRQQVAVKIARKVAAPAALEWFRDERQILANLQHPNIARLLDGGTTDEGVPYLVMEYVEGTSIDVYCSQRHLGVGERLRLFRRVCDAVQYAHQRLVIHQDLKPSNILVQADGEPKLLDFGTARLLSETADANSSPARPMTPEYASPEQIRGERIATTSDVYSLGVLLYQLLTGGSPYRDVESPQALAVAICETEPAKPSTVVARLAGDLDDIILKALRKAQQERYSSVEQLSDDIRRHLERLPIVAAPGSARYRAAKFISRHRIGVAAGAIVLVAILIGAAATAWQARLARGQAALARAESARAERRFNDVRKLANSMIFELHDAIQDLPGSTAARKLLIERALQYLDSLAAEAADNPALQRELADAYTRIGQVQGGPFAANVGDTALAMRSYEQAMRIRQALAAAHSPDVRDLVGLAEINRLTANALVSVSTTAALARAHGASAILEAALASSPRDRRLLDELMRDYATEADIRGSVLVNSSVGDIDAALPLRRRQLEIAETLSGLEPGNRDARMSMASALNAMGDQLVLTGRRREASGYLRRAQQLLADLAGASTSTKLLLGLHDSYYRLVPVHIADGDLASAESMARRAVNIARQLVAADAENTQARVILAADYANLADVLSRAHNQGAARELLGRAMAVDAELVRRHPDSAPFRNIHHQRLLIGGDMALRSGDCAQAAHYYGDAATLLRQMMAADPQNEGTRLRLSFVSNGLAASLSCLGDLGAARDKYQYALGLFPAALESGSTPVETMYAVADSFAGLGDVEVRAAASARAPGRSSHLLQALTWFDRSLELWRQVKEPGVASPSGYKVMPPREVEERRAKLRAEISKRSR